MEDEITKEEKAVNNLHKQIRYDIKHAEKSLALHLLKQFDFEYLMNEVTAEEISKIRIRSCQIVGELYSLEVNHLRKLTLSISNNNKKDKDTSSDNKHKLKIRLPKKKND